MLLPREPLHVARIVPAALAQGDDVVHLAVLTTRRLRVAPLELIDRLRITLDPPVAVPFAGHALDRRTASAARPPYRVRGAYGAPIGVQAAVKDAGHTGVGGRDDDWFTASGRPRTARGA